MDIRTPDGFQSTVKGVTHGALDELTLAHVEQGCHLFQTLINVGMHPSAHLAQFRKLALLNGLINEPAAVDTVVHRFALQNMKLDYFVEVHDC